MTIALDEWLGVIGPEYIDSFIPAGGGAVRFVVADAEELEQAGIRLLQLGKRAGLHAIDIDLASTRLHMLQNLFFAIARALPWEPMLQARLMSFLAEAGYRAPDPAAGIEALAAANGVAAHLLRREFNQWLTRAVWHDAALARDFRNAMIALLTARLTGEDDALNEAVGEWLQGTLRSVGQVRRAQIGARIGRHNARAMLMSLCHWVRSCASADGGNGILLLMDIRRLHREPREIADGLRYSPAAVMDCYEVLRQVIDDAEHFPGLFVVVLADQALLSENPRRSLMQYTALQMRVADDVHPHERDNPLAPLVRLAA